jgi:DNA replication licensing factor MCM6
MIPQSESSDEAGEIVKNKFYEFLTQFEIDSVEQEANNLIANVSSQGMASNNAASQHQRLMTDYQAQISHMIQTDKTTLFVNFDHIKTFDYILSEAVEVEYYRFEPYLRKSLQQYVGLNHQDYINDPNKGPRQFFVAIYNLPRVERIRNMRTDRIGRLVCISGTVTRSSEVRPELLFGNFTCRKCGTNHPLVEQQFQYTEPQVCRNPQCPNRDFQLVLNECTFVDWQRLRVQENADEIPPGKERSYIFLCWSYNHSMSYLGSMPRCIDVICRNEIVEAAKAGDKVIFTGTLAVVPDSSGNLY